MKLSTSTLGAAFFTASAMLVLALWIFVHTPGKNMFSTIPLFWLAVLVCAPIVSAASTAALWRREVRWRWLAGVATLLTLPQLLIWLFIAAGVLHYLD